jgi:hypothetical protein
MKKLKSALSEIGRDERFQGKEVLLSKNKVPSLIKMKRFTKCFKGTVNSVGQTLIRIEFKILQKNKTKTDTVFLFFISII